MPAAAWHFAWVTLKDFNRINGQYMAAAIAFYSFLSMFPTLMLMLWVVEHLLIFERFELRFKEAIDGLLPILHPGLGPSFVESFIRHVVGTDNDVHTLYSLVMFSIGSLGVFGAIRKSMNAVWGVGRDLNPVLQKVVDAAMMVAAISVLFVSLMSSVLLNALSDVFELNQSLAFLIRWIVVPLLTFPSIIVVFTWVPNRHIPVKDVVWAAVATYVAFEVVRLGFNMFVGVVDVYFTAFHGRVISIFLFFLYVYFQASALLLGAMLAAELTMRKKIREDEAAARSIIDPAADSSVSLNRGWQPDTAT